MNRPFVFFIISIFVFLSANLFALDNGYECGSQFTICGVQDSWFKAVGTNGQNFLVLYHRSGGLYGRIVQENGVLSGSEFSVMPSLTNVINIDVYIASAGTNYFITAVSDNYLYGTLLNSAGTVIVSEFLINSPSGDQFRFPAVASNGSGYFVIWLKTWTDGTDSIKAVYGRMYDLNANPTTSEFKINEEDIVSNYISRPSVASNGSGYFVVWTAVPAQPASPTKYAAGRLYNSNGQSLSGEFRMDTLTDERSVEPQIVSTGDLYLPFWEYQQIYTAISSYRIMLRQYDAEGNPIRAEFNVANSRDVFSGTHIGVSAGVSQNAFIIFNADAWISESTVIYAQLIDSNGFPIGSEFVAIDSTYFNYYNLVAKVNDTYLCTWNDSNERVFGRLLTKSPHNITITQQPQSATTYVGEDAVFSVDAASTTGPVTYQWYRNNEPIANSSSILVQDAQLSDDHTFFYCDIRDNDGGFVRTDAAVMTVLPPLFTVSIQGPEYLFGDTSAQYTAIADYGNGFIFDVTEFVQWLVSPSDLGEINLAGLFSADIVFDHQTALLEATLTDGGETHSTYFSVNIDLPFQVVSMNPAPGSVETSAPLEIVITLSDSVGPASVNTDTCMVIKAGSDGEFGTDDDTIIPCIPTVTGLQEITLDISESILPNDLYQIKLSGILNSNLTPLDGEYSGSFPSGDNYPYGDFAASFSIQRLITSGIIFNDNDTVTLTWDPFKDGTVYVVEYTDDLTAWLPVEPLTQWPITATTWTGGQWMGYPSRFFRVSGIVPSIYSVSPDVGYQGDFSQDVEIVVFGIPLDGTVDVDFGAGIIVHSVSVINSSQLSVNIRISFEASAGYRDVTITTDQKVYIEEDAFEVLAN